VRQVSAIGLHARLGAVGRRLEMRNMHLDAPTEPASIHAALAFASRLALLVLLLRNSGSPPDHPLPLPHRYRSAGHARTHARTGTFTSTSRRGAPPGRTVAGGAHVVPASAFVIQHGLKMQNEQMR